MLYCIDFITLEDTTTTPISGDCRDLILDGCSANSSISAVVTVENIDMESCIALCDHIAEPNCKSFVYNQSSSTCELYDVTIDSYIHDCNFYGSGQDTFHNCLTNDTKHPDPCNVTEDEWHMFILHDLPKRLL